MTHLQGHIKSSFVFFGHLVQNLEQALLERRRLPLLHDLIYIHQQVVQRVTLLDALVDVEHHLPVQLHLLAEVVLQMAYERVHVLQFFLHLKLDIDGVDFFFSLAAGLPLLFLVLEMVPHRHQMQVHLVGAPTLPLEGLLALVESCVVSQILGTIPVGVVK